MELFNIFISLFLFVFHRTNSQKTQTIRALSLICTGKSITHFQHFYFITCIRFSPYKLTENQKTQIICARSLIRVSMELLNIFQKLTRKNVCIYVYQ